MIPYSHSTSCKNFTTTRHFVYDICLCFTHKIPYIILWLELSKSLCIYTYGHTGIMEIDSESGCSYLGDSGVDRHHRIIWNTHSTLSSSWFHRLLLRIHRSTWFVWSVTHSCQAFIYPRNSSGSAWPGITICHLTLFWRSLSQNYSIWKRPFTCHVRYSTICMTGCLPSVSTVSPHHDRGSLEIQLEANMMQVWIHLEAVIEGVSRCTWRPKS